MGGILKFGGIDCSAFPQICDQQKIQKFPSAVIYPPMPIPSVNWEGELQAKKIAATAGNYVSNLVQEVTDDNMEGFFATNPSMPKVILFTDKAKGVPLLWKGLSVAFEEKMALGVTRSDQADVTNKFAVKKFPYIVLTKAGERKPNVYTGGLKYQDIFEWINIFSEQFVYGGGSSADGAGVAPWLNEAVPEMFSKSAKDVCLGAEQVLCVILFTDAKPGQDTIDVLKDVRRVYDAKGDRAIHFKFMWLNADSHTEWASKFSHDGNPKVYVFNPGRRKRYLQHEGPITYDGLFNTLEKIVGGDGRFQMVRGNEVPEFSN